VAGQAFIDLPISNIRKVDLLELSQFCSIFVVQVTAERLLFSKQTIPHYYLTTEIRVDQLLKYVFIKLLKEERAEKN
jgi:hypothetical protein